MEVGELLERSFAPVDGLPTGLARLDDASVGRDRPRALANVYVAGARKPGFARGMGARTMATVEEALAETTAVLGREPHVLAVPRLSSPQFHLTAQG